PVRSRPGERHGPAHRPRPADVPRRLDPRRLRLDLGDPHPGAVQPLRRVPGAHLLLGLLAGRRRRGGAAGRRQPSADVQFDRPAAHGARIRHDLPVPADRHLEQLHAAAGHALGRGPLPAEPWPVHLEQPGHDHPAVLPAHDHRITARPRPARRGVPVPAAVLALRADGGEREIVTGTTRRHARGDRTDGHHPHRHHSDRHPTGNERKATMTLDASALGWDLPLPDEDTERSPVTGWTRTHWATVADNLLLAARRYASDGGAHLDLPGRPSRSGVLSDGLEGWARTFPLAAMRVRGEAGADPHGHLDFYRRGVVAGTRHTLDSERTAES